MEVIKLSREQKLRIITGLQEHLHREWELKMGELGAELLLDELVKQLYPFIYNQAIADCRKLLEQRISSLEDDLYALERPTPLPERDN